MIIRKKRGKFESNEEFFLQMVIRLIDRSEGKLEKREGNGIGETEGAGTQCLICS